MRHLTYFVATTLDGFISAPDGADPSSFWPVTPGYIAHHSENYPETFPAQAHSALGIETPARHFDTAIEARRSYEVGLAASVDNAYPHPRHLVVSTSLLHAPDPVIEMVRSDPVPRVRELKAEDGASLWLVGGTTLEGSLVDEIDRLILKVPPMTFRAGIPMWGRDAAPVVYPGGRRAGLCWRAAWSSRNMNRSPLNTSSGPID